MPKSDRLIRPPELSRNDPLLWSTGRGTHVWEMFVAAIDGDVEAVRRLLALDPSLVRAAWHYRRPMFFAVRENQIEVARLLLEHGADPANAWGDDTLLEIARDRGYTEMLAMLEQALAAKHQFSPRAEELAAAIRERDIPKVRTLLDASPELLHATDLLGNQPIHWAAMTRNVPLIDELLARGAHVDARRVDNGRPIQLTNGDYNYRGGRDVPKEVDTTPAEVLEHLRVKGAYCDLSTAAAIGDLKRVKELLAEDPSLANRVSDYVTYYIGSGAPLKNAAARGHMEIVKALLDAGAQPNLPEEGIAPHGHALYSAVYNGHHEIAQLLLDRGAYPSPPVESSADAMSIAQYKNKDEKMVDLLASYGSSRTVELLAYYRDVRTAAAVFAANPALADDPVALSTAARNGDEGFVRLMLRYVAGLAKRVGVAASTRELTELLFAQGMDPSHPNWLRVTPLHEFAMQGDLENAAMFLDHGADIHARDEDLNSTPLAWAAKFGRILMVDLLLRRGAKLSLPDDPAWATPLAWARRRGHKNIVELLTAFESNGAVPKMILAPFEAQAQDVLDAFTSGNLEALARVKEFAALDPTITLAQFRQGMRNRTGNDSLTLDGARQWVARWHGFETWADLETYIGSIV